MAWENLTACPELKRVSPAEFELGMLRAPWDAAKDYVNQDYQGPFSVRGTNRAFYELG